MADLAPHADQPSERPLRADAQRNRDRILEVARETFTQEGLGVPVDLIAERANVGVGTFYRHFPNKEVLAGAILASRLESLIGEAEQLEGAPDPGDAFFGFLRLMAERSSADMALADAFTEAGYDVKSGSAKFKERLLETLGRMLDRAQASGAVRADLTSSDVLALMAASCMATGRFGLSGADRDRVLGVVFDGLRPAGS
ncbi:MAG TPA: TetR/AcrR family transcriptional regulator [Gaiellales bacterium]|jgi:AcrR family transcriptional regulator|nr:TetR/AcrR family transcriptional regulator [Gaiellales bacterium]